MAFGTHGTRQTYVARFVFGIDEACQMKNSFRSNNWVVTLTFGCVFAKV